MHAIQAGGQRLDGGAMFGVVPKTLWERRIAPDERNRIQLGMRCLLIEHEIGPVLIDTGAGNKENDKFYDIYGIENRGAPGPTRLEDGLRELGFGVEDIVLVINSHLHFDHAGGNLTRDADGSIRPTFPNARYVFCRDEWDYFSNDETEHRARAIDACVRPIVDARLADIVAPSHVVTPGVRLESAVGHSPGHVIVHLESAGQHAFITGDLTHNPIQWAHPEWPGPDADPVRASQTRRELLARYADTPTLVLGTHYAPPCSGHIVSGGAGHEFHAVVPDRRPG